MHLVDQIKAKAKKNLQTVVLPESYDERMLFAAEKIVAEGLAKIVILGDILFSRVARSNIHALTKLGANVTIVGPSTLVPHWFEALGVQVSHNLRSALADADVVMLLRIHHERQASSHFPSLGEYTSMFGLNQTRAEWIKPDAIIMHPGPINRGVEIDSALADSPRSVILQQVTNGIAVRMAALYLCSGGQPEHVTTPVE